MTSPSPLVPSGSQIGGAGSSAVPQLRSRVSDFLTGTAAQYISWLLLAGASVGAVELVRWWASGSIDWWWPAFLLLVAALAPVGAIKRERFVELKKNGQVDDLKSTLREAYSKLDLERLKIDRFPNDLAEAQTVAAEAAVRDVFDRLSCLFSPIDNLIQFNNDLANIDQLRQSILDAAREIMPGKGYRVCFYRPDNGDDNRVPENALKMERKSGRTDAPRPFFDSSTPYGRRFIHTAMLGREPDCVHDALEKDETISRASGAVYLSFMVVPVVNGSDRYGALSFDCPEQVVFGDSHKRIGSFMAQMMAIVEAQAEARSRDLQPELQDALDQIALLNRTEQ